MTLTARPAVRTGTTFGSLPQVSMLAPCAHRWGAISLGNKAVIQDCIGELPSDVREHPRDMFRSSYQSGVLSVLYSIGSKPLQLWAPRIDDGSLRRVMDDDIQSSVLDLTGPNVSTSYITCPADPNKSLGIKLPYLVLVVKNLHQYFTFEVQVLDDKNIKRRFRASNYQTATRIKPSICTMPMSLDEGWNQIQFDLADFVKRAYGTNYMETLRLQVHANCRLRRIYFAEKLYAEHELPAEFKLFLPAQKPQRADEKVLEEPLTGTLIDA